MTQAEIYEKVKGYCGPLFSVEKPIPLNLFNAGPAPSIWANLNTLNIQATKPL